MNYKPLKLYKSSAGSGKTYTLVREYLKLVLKNPDLYKNILAITFTNKAANEMKERILAKLKELQFNKDELFYFLLKETNIKNEEIFINNCYIVLKNILHNYSDFAIMTIDSFIFKIVKTFSLELELPLNFEIDLNISLLIQKITDNLINHAGEDEYVIYILKNFVKDKILTSGTWNFQKDIIEAGKEIFKEQTQSDIKKISELNFKIIIEELFTEQNRIETEVKNIGLKIEKIYNSVVEKDLPKRGPKSCLLYMLKINEPNIFQNDIESKVYEKIVDNEVFFKNPEDYSEYNNKLISLRNKLIELLNKYFTLKSILKTIFSMALFNKLRNLIETYKKENNIVPISEFNQKVADIIDKEIIPFIYWKTGEKIFHFFIDEFQDTSRIQWKNLKPLIENAMSYNYFNLVVGDAKQSIYRWRGGNANIMLNEIYRDFPNKINEEVLYKNYRSSKDIVNFNNLFFSDISKQYLNLETNDIEKVYEKEITVQKIHNNENGYVEFSIIKENKKNNEKNYSDLALEKLLEKIIYLLNEQKYNMKDITVLVRTNNEGSKIAKYLYEKSINVISPESLMLNSSFLIRLLINSLNYIISKNNIYKKGIYINYVRFKNINKKNEILFLNAGYEYKNDFEEIIVKLMNLKFMNLYDITEELIKIFNLRKNKENYIYIQSFLDVVHNYSSKYSDDIKNFLNWWEENLNSESTSVRIPENINAIRILSIHKAKGLEFPVVLMPFGIWEIGLKSSTGFIKNYLWAKPSKNILDEYNNEYMIESNQRLNNTYFYNQYKIEKENSYLDNLNLYYVAWTRPVKELYVFIKEGKETEKLTSYNLIFNKLNELKEKNYMKNEDNIYYTGKKSYNKNPKIDETAFNIREINLLNWRENLLIKKNTSYTEEIIKGKIIHKILSNIIVEEDINFAVDKILKNNYIINISDKEIKETLNKIMLLTINEKKCIDWFKKGLTLEIEKSIYSPHGVVRPDRIVFYNNSVDIIDYKTGQEEEKYKYQLHKYAEILETMKYKNVNKYILYIDLLKIIKV